MVVVLRDRPSGTEVVGSMETTPVGFVDQEIPLVICARLLFESVPHTCNAA